MADKHNLRNGGRILVDALVTQGADHAFCVPGESYLAVLDAFHDTPEIAVTVCRQEGGACMMADAYGKQTGRPGLCFVTRGPGASNACVGMHTAHQDSTPLILFIGQVGGDVVEREAFQEVDFRRMYGPMCKWVAQIDRADRVPEYVSHAFHTAVSGRPGPVVLALPEDMQTQTAAVPVGEHYRRVAAYPSPAAIERLRQMLAQAEHVHLARRVVPVAPQPLEHACAVLHRRRVDVDARLVPRHDLAVEPGEAGMGVGHGVIPPDCSANARPGTLGQTDEGRESHDPRPCPALDGTFQRALIGGTSRWLTPT